MTPSDDRTAPEVQPHPAASLRLQVMRTRPEFLRAARARYQSTDTVLLQARERGDGSLSVHVGFTCSKKLGNAVTRNRAKRRLRHIATELLSHAARPGWDYVLVGRPGTTVSADYDKLRRDLGYALTRVHKVP